MGELILPIIYLLDGLGVEVITLPSLLLVVRGTHPGVMGAGKLALPRTS